MRKTGAAAILVTATLLLVIWGCSKTGTDVQSTAPQLQLTCSQSECLPGSERSLSTSFGEILPQSYSLNTPQSQCLEGSEGVPAESTHPGGTVRFEASYDTLFLYHDSAVYLCCEEFIFALEMDGSTLDFIEVDTSWSACYCWCYYNLETSVAGLWPGTYTVRLWTEEKAILIDEAEVTIPGGSGVSFETRCDTLLVDHNARWANCGSKIIFDFQQHDSLLVFTELDTSTTMMHCMCYFDLAAQVSGLANGTYNGGHIQNRIQDTLIAESVIDIFCPLGRSGW